MITTAQAELVNIGFEVFCAAVAWFNVFKIFKDKQVSGIFWQSWIIFVAWRYWDFFYMYPALQMHIAQMLTLGSAIGQTVWTVAAIYFSYFKTKPVVRA